MWSKVKREWFEREGTLFQVGDLCSGVLELRLQFVPFCFQLRLFFHAICLATFLPRRMRHMSHSRACSTRVEREARGCNPQVAIQETSISHTARLLLTA
eukprot:1382265-Rhodomonas_salina.1